MPDDASDITQSTDPGVARAAEGRRVVLPGRPVQVTIAPQTEEQPLGMDVHPSQPAQNPQDPPLAETAEAEAAATEAAGDQTPETTERRSRWEWTQDPVVRQTSTILTIGALIAAVVAMVVGFKPMSVRAGELRAKPVRVQIEWPPLAGQTTAAAPEPGGTPRTWVNQETRETLEALVLKTMSESPVDGEALTRTRQALLRTGWFTDALRVERSQNGLVRVGPSDGTSVLGLWRFPVAAVRQAGKDHLVASGGELLPLSYEPDASGMKLIVGVRTPAPAWGEAWLGGEVQAGLKLLGYVQSHPSFRAGTSGSKQLAAIDVSEFTPGKQLSIITERGTKVIWGGPLDTMNAGQVKDSVKLERLAMLVRDYGRMDAGQAMVDIRIEGNIYIVDQTPKAPPPDPAKKPSKRGSPGRAQASGERR